MTSTPLTTHFTLEELTASETAARLGFDNTPNEAETENLQRLAEFLEEVKKVLGMKPVMINSAFRSKQTNDAVGSRDTSQHRIGCAADIRIPGMNPDEVCRAVIVSGIAYDQIIREFWDKDKGGGWTHISVPNTKDMTPRRQALIIDKTGTRPFV
jgi:zinc D-Ala-D-Ala carboxypeptidase